MSLDELQAQLRGALDQQFAALKTHYESAIADARQDRQHSAVVGALSLITKPHLNVARSKSGKWGIADLNCSR